MNFDVLLPATLFVFGVVVLAVRCLWVGRRRVPVVRRLSTAVVLAALAALPAVPASLWGTSLADGEFVRVVGPEGETIDPAPVVLELPSTGAPNLVLISLIWLVQLGWAVQCLRLPWRLRHLETLAPVADPAVVARIRELAARLRVSPPTVVRMSTGDGSLIAQAFAAGVLAPVVAITDGITDRLTADERDAIIAHELAHLGRRSLLRFLAAAALAGLVAVSWSGCAPIVDVLVWWLAAVSCSRSLAGHREEVQADLAAARCVGFATTSAALDKIHHAGEIGDLSPWLHAVASHPSLAARRHHLQLAAPPDEAAAIEVDLAAARRARRARVIAVVIWLLLLAGQAVAIVWTRSAWTMASAVVLLLLPFLPYLKIVRHLRETWQLHGFLIRRWLVHVVGQVIVVSVGLVVLFFVLFSAFSGWVACLVGVICLLAWHLAGRRRRQVMRGLSRARLQADPPGFLALYEAAGAAVQRDPANRMIAILCMAATGQREDALSRLAALCAERPRFHIARLWQVVLVGRRDPAVGVQLARVLLARLPGNASAAALLAAQLRRAGEPDAAGQLIGSLLRRHPRRGSLWAHAARIARARGEREAAAAALATAERLDPGGVHTVVARAEHDAVTASPAAAESLARLRALRDRQPFTFLDEDIAAITAIQPAR